MHLILVNHKKHLLVQLSLCMRDYLATVLSPFQIQAVAFASGKTKNPNVRAGSLIP